MPETPVDPPSVRGALFGPLIGVGESFSRRGKRGFLAAAAVLLGALIAILYFTVFPIPQPPGQSGQVQSGPRLDQSAIAVANRFTQLGWNEHNCRAASRYSVGARCPTKVLPTGTYTFVLNTWQIQHRCANTRPGSPSLAGRISPSCIKYTAANGQTISYTMAKLPQGWLVVGVRGVRGAPIPSG
jgi:hypothetical protein